MRTASYSPWAGKKRSGSYSPWAGKRSATMDEAEEDEAVAEKRFLSLAYKWIVAKHGACRSH